MLANIIRNRKKTGIGGGGGGIVIDNGDPFYSAVSLLLPMDGTNGSTTFTDSSLNALTVTAVGNAQISTTQSKYGGASGYFDGTGDYLMLPSSSAFNFGTGDFTLEFWTYPLSGPVSTYNPCFYSQNAWDNAAWAANNAGLRVHHSNVILGGSSFTQINFSSNIQNNQWSHIAVVRAGNTVTVYINGSSVGSATYSGNVGFSTCRPGIGLSDTGSTGGREYPNGYIDDFRISRFARYVSNFTPPTAALPTTASSTPADPYYGNTSLLLHMDGTNASTNFVDSGPNALAVTASGNAQITTTQSKFGGASGSFNGTNAFLSPGSASASQFDFGTGDFTIEGWFYFNSFGGANYAPLFANSYLFYVGASGEVLVFNGSSNVVTGTAGNVSLNSWTHIAYSRSGSTLRVFVNGIQKASATVSASIGTSASNYIGRYGSVYLNACIDDLRITKGVARYTSAFAPPAQAHPNA